MLFFDIVSLYFNTLFTSVSSQMALYIPHSIFYLARLLYVRPVTFGPYYVINELTSIRYGAFLYVIILHGEINQKNNSRSESVTSYTLLYSRDRRHLTFMLALLLAVVAVHSDKAHLFLLQPQYR